MLYLLILVIIITVLFFISKLTIKKIAQFFYRLTKNKNTTIYLLSFLFFPGTVVHELSHAAMAALLQVNIGDISLWPNIDGDQVKLGSVQIERTDFIRRFIIGVAPVIFGVALLYAVVFFTLTYNKAVILNYIIAGYSIFTVSNSMYSSKRDMEGALEFLILLLCILVTALVLGFRPWQFVFPQVFVETLSLLDKLLISPILIDLAIILSFVLLKKLRKNR